MSSSQSAAYLARRERVFDAVLETEVPWRRLGGSALCALSLLGLLLVAVASGARHSVQEQRFHVDPMVTFLDVPKPSPDEPAPKTTLASGGAAGAVSDQISNGSTFAKAHGAPALQKPERAATLTDRAKETVADEAPRDTSATPAPLAQGSGRANEGPAVPSTSVSAGTGAVNALGSGAGGGGGTGSGNGGGVGGGVGSGIQVGTAGRFGVLPFGDGMSRPVLQSKIDPTYTREAAEARVQGVALVKCVLTTDGAVRNCRVVKGLPFMNDAVVAAVSRWRYSPVVYQGSAVSVDYLITLHLSPP